MARTLTTFFSGWKHGTADDYNLCYNLYGGSFMTHPDVLSFLENRLNLKSTYFVKRDKDNKLLGGFCTWNNRSFAATGKDVQRSGIDFYPFNKDEIILPLGFDLKTSLPFKTKILSCINGDKTRNVTYKFNSQRSICLAKGCGESGFSSSTKNSRRRELKRFLNAGGEFRDQSQFSPEELTAIYCDLYEKRWGSKPGNKAEMLDMISVLREMFFGYVLLFDGKPCAFQLITKAESPEWICFDYVNGGLDRLHDSFCPGTIVTWLNVNSAYDLCTSMGKTMRYSFGKPTEGYKERWCYRSPLGRVISL
ncbi:GNAT family N-acetyltransferase [Erwinia pyrifoliae]|uniref:GNAT family N-acetyltransferase n=1 Tax=Erwinia pyrifoliae TaxID=79967 RepID=UPI0001960E0B|nr:GNAT family N-acetyltransferase [Erwinia pyrifoliae]AUX72504.1 Mig-14 family protein [Erwinia pyrifoliae]MCA8877244.1 Mig-14 family protein [Erwinia pyrifoliae]UWS30841.1 antimicrobial resistance protein Mig-14 [Erwinia pyrifoliae]UXK13860.1 antimicrobial resistance protein Mig-14 [Erwinia pyrifoliae]CAX55807.1 Putative exopolysaccharide protein, Mig-14 family [Erwinia pyrifoliae Ep1/96]